MTRSQRDKVRVRWAALVVLVALLGAWLLMPEPPFFWKFLIVVAGLRIGVPVIVLAGTVYLIWRHLSDLKFASQNGIRLPAPRSFPMVAALLAIPLTFWAYGFFLLIQFADPMTRALASGFLDSYLLRSNSGWWLLTAIFGPAVFALALTSYRPALNHVPNARRGYLLVVLLYGGYFLSAYLASRGLMEILPTS